VFGVAFLGSLAPSSWADGFPREVDEVEAEGIQHLRWVLLAAAPGSDGTVSLREIEIYSRPAPQVNIASGATVSASSTQAGAVRHLGDGRLKTWWRSGPLPPSQWILFSFPVPITPSRLVVVHADAANWLYRYRVEGSEDGLHWIEMVPEKKAYPYPLSTAQNTARLPLSVSVADHARVLYGCYANAIERNWQRRYWRANLRTEWLAASHQAERFLELWASSFALLADAAFEDRRLERMLKNFWRWQERNPSFDAQAPGYGLLPRAILPEGQPVQDCYRASQTPALAWALWQAYQQTGRRSLLEESFPRLVLYHRWFTTERDVDRDALIEVGSYSGSVNGARAEAFAGKPSLARLRLTPPPRQPQGEAVYGDVETVEQTVFVILMEQALAGMAKALDQPAVAQRYQQLALQRGQALRRTMYDPESGFFYDVTREKNQPLQARCVSGFLPLVAEVCTNEQAQHLTAHLKNPKEFWTAHPLPTLAANEPGYRETWSWRGDMRPELNYLVAAGLNRYGYFDLARKLTAKTLATVDENLACERYGSQTGEPCGASFHAVSAALLPMIYENEYGLRADFRTLRLDPAFWGRELRVGGIQVQHRRSQEVVLWTAVPRPLTLILPSAWRNRPLNIQRLQPQPREPIAYEQIGPGQVRFEAALAGTYRIARGP